MTKKEKQVIQEIAMVLTRKQDEDVDLVHAAHALWMVIRGNAGIKSAERDVEELKRNH